nr:phosphoglucosamine mutase [Nitratifractor salsuginis]
MGKLFGTDGVRGKAGVKVSAPAAMRLAMATGAYFRPHSRTNKILVGKDTRRSGYMIENAIVSGLTAVGYDVIQIGPMPTPAVAFLTENMRCDAGIMISASHNPYYDNGIKFFDAEGNKLNREVEEKIEAIYQDDEAIARAQKTGKEIGKSKRIDDVIGRYIVHIKNSFPRSLTLSGLRVVVDCANGAGYRVAPTVLSELGADVVVLGDEPNGFNINEGCGAMHPEYLAKEVLRYRADVGVALDGDADRLVMVDERGEVIDGDKLMGVLAIYLKEQGTLRNDGMVATVMSNQALDDYLARHAITLYRSAVGDKNVVEMMQSKGLNFGGEQSGHIIFSDFAKTGDGISSALQALAYLVSSGKRASEAFNPFELYPQKLVNLNVATKRPLEEIRGLAELQEKIEAAGMRHLFRYSGTENKIRLLIEGKDAQALEEAMEEAEALFRRELVR